MIVRLKNDIGMVKEAKIGFSFTTFFFGAFVPALRGDWKYAGIMLVCAIITSGISTLVFTKFLLNVNDSLTKYEDSFSTELSSQFHKVFLTLQYHYTNALKLRLAGKIQQSFLEIDKAEELQEGELKQQIHRGKTVW